MIRLLSLETAHPALKLSQREALAFVLRHFKVHNGTRALYEKVFSNPSVAERRFSLERLEDVLEEDPDLINRRFEKQSVELSARSLKAALERAGLPAERLDFLAASTCTGYLCPGLGARLIEACGLRRDLRYVDVVGMGCGSAIPALEQAHNFLTANPGARAATVSTEICSAAMVSDDAPDLVVSNALFADGSAAAVLASGGEPGLASLKAFSCLTYPEWKEGLRFRTQDGRLRNVLAREVPAQAAEAVSALARKILSERGLAPDRVRHWILHAGGGKVLDAVRDGLGLAEEEVAHARAVLRQYGNLSSPSVLYALRELLDGGRRPRAGEAGLMISFGAGFSAHACLLEFP